MEETAIVGETRDQWYATAYRELERISRHHLRANANGTTLCTTDLVHEAYLKLDAPGNSWENRAHFFAAASRAMREVLVDHARRRTAGKRGGGAAVITLTSVRGDLSVRIDELLVLDDALERLRTLNARLLVVVEMRYFGGFEDHEIARVLNVSTRTVERDWLKARGWLYRELRH
jgi:RNA polymerase sigma factor (TIGR02999 family)